jgi:hypothetical protein
MTSSHIFQWEGTDNPNDPSGVATFKCDGRKVSAIFHDFVTASELSHLISAAYERGKHDAINTAAVLAAYYSEIPMTGSNRLSAALRALAVRINGADAIRQDILDIADELEGQ